MSPPEMRRPRHGSGADATPDDQPAESYPSHETYMRQLASRIAWLERHEHWWIRDVRRRQDVAA
jgi:hypothetical protein